MAKYKSEFSPIDFLTNRIILVKAMGKIEEIRTKRERHHIMKR